MAESADRPVRGKLLVYIDAHHFRLAEAEEDKLLDGLNRRLKSRVCVVHISAAGSRLHIPPRSSALVRVPPSGLKRYNQRWR